MFPVTNYIINIIGDSPEIREAINGIVYFRNASQNLISLIVRFGKIVKLNKGDTGIKEGDFDQWVYIILEGSLDVYVGEQKIDSIRNTLVGERCILGESRKASLKASEGGAILLGIDMAILDALQSEPEEGKENVDFGSCVELISNICSAVYARISQLWFLQVAKKSIFSKYFVSQVYQEIFLDLFHNKFKNNAEVNGVIAGYLKSNFPHGLSCVDEKKRTLDTRALALMIQQENKPELLGEILDKVYEIVHEEEIKKYQLKLNQVMLKNFNDVSIQCHGIFKEFISDTKKLEDSWFKDIYNIGENGVINLYGMCKKMEEGFDLAPQAQMDALIKTLDYFATLNLEINKHTMGIFDSLSILELKELKSKDQDFFDPLNFSITGEELITHDAFEEVLVNPYLKALEEKDGKKDNVVKAAPEEKKVAEESKDEASAKYNQSDIDSLFDQFG